jgi:general secretion pathway protein M
MKQQPPTPALPLLRQQLSSRWQALGERERLALQLGGTALGLLLLWLVALQPALRTVQQAPAQLSQLDGQLQQMQRLAEEARELRALPAVPAAQALQALRAASEHLGPAARLSVTGDRAVLSLNGVSSEALQTWLGEVRSAARARPVEASLQRGPQGYSGSVVLTLGTAAP